MANDKKKTSVEDDVLFRLKPDRRLLSYAPDVTGHRTNRDRRGRDSADTGTSSGYIKLQQDDKNGQRYLVDYSVTVRFTLHGQKKSVQMKGEDISTTGILLTTPSSAEQVPLMEAEDVRLTFEITPGSMPEGYEMMVRKIPATCVREASRPDGASLWDAVQVHSGRILEYTSQELHARSSILLLGRHRLCHRAHACRIGHLFPVQSLALPLQHHRGDFPADALSVWFLLPSDKD